MRYNENAIAKICNNQFLTSSQVPVKSIWNSWLRPWLCFLALVRLGKSFYNICWNWLNKCIITNCVLISLGITIYDSGLQTEVNAFGTELILRKRCIGWRNCWVWNCSWLWREVASFQANRTLYLSNIRWHFYILFHIDKFIVNNALDFL